MTFIVGSIALEETHRRRIWDEVGNGMTDREIDGQRD